MEKFSKYTGLSEEHFATVMKRYEAFQDACNDLNKEPVKVFNPLSKKSLDEIQLIREVSKELQRKKEEDVAKAAQAAAEAEKAAAEKAAEEKQEGENEGETKTETEN